MPFKREHREVLLCVPLSWPERLILFTELCWTVSLFLLNFIQRASPGPNTNQPCWMLHLNLQVLTAAVDKSGNGWQGDFLELWGHDGNRRLIHPGLCNNNPAVTMTLQAGHDRKPWPRNCKTISNSDLCLQHVLHQLGESRLPKEGSNSVEVKCQHTSALGRLHCISFPLLGPAPTASCHSVAAALKSEGFWCMLPAAKSLLIRK